MSPSRYSHSSSGKCLCVHVSHHTHNIQDTPLVSSDSESATSDVHMRCVSVLPGGSRHSYDLYFEENSLEETTEVEACQVRVYSGRGSGQVQTKTDKGQGQGAGQGVSPAGVGDCLDSTTKDNEH